MRKAVKFRNKPCYAEFGGCVPVIALSRTSYVGNSYGWNTYQIKEHFGQTPYDFWESV